MDLPYPAIQFSITKHKSLTALEGTMATEVIESEAAHFNRTVMRKPQTAIEADPEVV